MRDVLPTIYGDADIPHKQDLLFTRLESITDKTTVDAKPDFYDGAPLGSIDKQVREDLSPYIIPTAHRTAPVAPNFFYRSQSTKWECRRGEATNNPRLGFGRSWYASATVLRCRQASF